MRPTARLSLFFVLVMACAACIPATPPPHLVNTPGAAVIVTEDVITTPVFTLTPPEGWRVITSPADAPLTITLAAADNCAVMLISVQPIELPTLPCDMALDTQNERAGALYTSLTAPTAAWDVYQRLYGETVRSLTMR